MKRILITILLVVAVAIGGLFVFRNRNQIQQDVLSYDVPEAVTFEEIEIDGDDISRSGSRENEPEPVLSGIEGSQTTSYDTPGYARDDLDKDIVLDDASVVGDFEPSSFNLAVPFTSQAPHSNWDLPYQEACEEASVLMVVAFFDDELVDLKSTDSADEAILSVVAFEQENYDMYLDTSAEETSRFAMDMYHDYNFTLLNNPSIDDIKYSIATGSPVIVPAAGRQLGNPNFSGEGPLYHMLVIRGYTESTFVTNDPGTRNGNGYVYSQQTIMDAMGDWNNGNPALGDKVVIVVSKK